MKFKDLPVWSRFEFDLSDLPTYLRRGMIQGPLLKVSKRCYLQTGDNPDALGANTSLDGHRCQVGSVNTKVVKL